MTTVPQDDQAPFLTVREMVVEIRQDVKELKARVGSLERDGFRLKGTATGVVVAVSCIAGVGGLILGLVAYV